MSMTMFLSVGAGTLHAQTMTDITADAQVGPASIDSTIDPIQCGFVSGTGVNAVLVFQLPELPSGQGIATAAFSVYYSGTQGAVTYNCDLYGLPYRASSTALTSDYYAGALDTNSTLLQASLVTPTTAAGTIYSSSAGNISLANYLDAQYAAGGVGNYIFIRINPNAALANNYTRYKFHSAEYSNTVLRAKITYTTALLSNNVAIGGGGAVTGVYADPTTSGRFYMRTDVGGIFRMDSGSTQWKPISEGFSYTNNGNDYGINSVAIDPNNAGTIYAYTGKYNYTNYSSHIYKSTNAGDTWVPKGIPTGLQGLSNLMDHSRSGEKLAVDPNNSNVLYIASLNVGLWKSTNGSTSWTKVMSSGTTPFPSGYVSGQASTGLSFVTFDRTGGLSGTVSAIAFVGVSDGTSGNGGVWRTIDGGANWTQMTGGFTNPARAAVASDGTLYVTYLTNGGVFRAARGSTTLTSCAPSSTVPFCGLAIDPVSPQTVYVSQNATSYGNTTWRTTNGGTSWTPVGNVHGISNAGTRQGSQWFGRIGQIAINPFNTNELWMGDWLGVLRTTDVTNTSTPWDYLYQGHEEVVPLALRCAPTGAPLLSGAADVNGLRHADIDQYPLTSFATSSGSTTIGSTTGLDFCEGNPNYWAKVSYVISGGVTAYSSTNNGVNWKQMPTRPSGATGGRIAMSANDPNNLVWKREDGTTYYTVNGGTNWYTCSGYPKLSCGEWDTTRQGLASNRVTNGYFYMFGVSGTYGYVYRSVNGGATWSAYSNAINIGGVATNPANYTLLAMPGNANELWLTVSGGGILKSIDGGLTFNTVTGASGHLLAFGKAAPGHTNPAVYLTNTAATPTYRSDDDGATWVTITDPTVPINNNVKLFAADMQVFGRYYIGTDGRGIYVRDSN